MRISPDDDDEVFRIPEFDFELKFQKELTNLLFSWSSPTSLSQTLSDL